MFEEGRSEALCALSMFEKLGAANDAEEITQLLKQIDRNARGVDMDVDTSDKSDDNGELVGKMLLAVY